MSTLATKPATSDAEIVLTKAVLNAANKLGVNGVALAPILGVSEATVSRMKRGDAYLERETKALECGVLFVRLFRSLDAIVGGDEAAARAWLSNPNRALDGKPCEQIRTIPGLYNVINYLDARRAPI
jgi:uncharacterized protein (DUF2384 family)